MLDYGYARYPQLPDSGVVLTTDANEVRLAPRSYYILPNAPLTPGQQYTVVFEATGRAGSYAKTWRFTTQN